LAESLQPAFILLNPERNPANPVEKPPSTIWRENWNDVAGGGRQCQRVQIVALIESSGVGCGVRVEIDRRAGEADIALRIKPIAVLVHGKVGN